MSESLSRNALLVKFFMQLYRRIPRTNLMKYIYEADLLAREYLGRPLSTFRYIRYKHGPYDAAIEDAVSELIDAGHADEIREAWTTPFKSGAYKRLEDQGQPVAFDFELAESAILDYVVRNYLDMPIKEFLHDVIYQTAPMKASSRLNEPLPMHLVDGAGTARVGFELAVIVEAEQDMKRGAYVTLSDFVGELQSQAPA